MIKNELGSDGSDNAGLAVRNGATNNATQDETAKPVPAGAPTAAVVGTGRSHRVPGKLLWLTAGGVVVAVAAVSSYLLFAYRPQGSPAVVSTLTYNNAGLLAFTDKLAGGGLQHNLTDVNGRIVKSLSSADYPGIYSTSNLIEPVFSRAVLTTNKGSAGYATLTSRGVTPVAASLTALLNSDLNNPDNGTSLLYGDAALVDGSTLLDVEYTNTSTQYVRIDLRSGTVTPLFTIGSTRSNFEFGYAPVQVSSLSSDGKMIYLLTDDAKIGGQALPGSYLISCDTATGKYTTTKLPDAVDVYSAAVSHDGSKIAHVVAPPIESSDTEKHLYIYDVKTGHDVPIKNTAVEDTTGGDYSNFLFSPNNAYVYLGHAETPKTPSTIQVFSIGQATLVKTVSSSSLPYSCSISGDGWAAPTVLIYSSCTLSDANGNFDSTHASTYSVNIVTGQTYVYPKSLGLGAIILPN